jgi:hypothetical protein
MSAWRRLGPAALVGVLLFGKAAFAAPDVQASQGTTATTEGAAIDSAEPAPAPLVDEKSLQQEEEPPPAALLPDPAEIELAAQKRTLAKKHSAYGAVGYTAAVLTFGWVVAGSTLGMLAQSRSDELSRLTLQSGTGLPPVYDDAQREAYERVQQEGQSFKRATIACFIVAGGATLGTGVLFWRRSRVESAQKKLALIPSLSSQHASLALVGRW